MRLLGRALLAATLALTAAACQGEPTEAALPLSGLVARSDAIVTAVLTGEVEAFPAESPPRSVWTFRVLRAAGGRVAEDLVRIQFEGEPFENEEAARKGFPLPAKGTEYLLFLRATEPFWTIEEYGYFEVRGSDAVRLPAAPDGIPRRVAVDDIFGLADAT